MLSDVEVAAAERSPPPNHNALLESLTHMAAMVWTNGAPMKRRIRLGLMLLACIVISVVTSHLGRTVVAQARRSQLTQVPKFRVDPAWPKIPNNWIFGWTSSVFVDDQDHVWVLQRPGSL